MRSPPIRVGSVVCPALRWCCIAFQQDLGRHIHVHALVAGGALSADGKWVSAKRGFLFPVKALSGVYRGKFMEALDRVRKAGVLRHEAAQSDVSWRTLFAAMRRHDWVVYAKQPLCGPAQVLEYLGRYTHRVAISNSRLVEFADGRVAFRWKDYRHESQPKVMRLDAQEFVRRFLLHVLPSGLQRIRHYGLLANRHRAAKLARCRALLEVPAPASAPPDEVEDYRDRYRRLTGVSLSDCPQCGRGQMVCIESFLPSRQPRGPPQTSQ